MANRVWISGYLTADVDVKRVLKDIENDYQRVNSAVIGNKRVMPVANFVIATSRLMPSGKMLPDYIHCAAWGRTAVNIQKYCGKKGMGIEVMGSLRAITKTVRGGQKVHTQDVWVDSWRYPPGNGEIMPTSIPEEPSIMPPKVNAEEREPSENNLPMPNIKPEIQELQAEPTAPYDYFEDEADADNFAPPEL